MFVDELTIHAKAGDGGDGAERWRNYRFQRYGGPAGGNGGHGGDVYARVVRDITVLARYRNNPNFFAEDGGDGGAESKTGKNGADCTIDVPIGSVITNTESGHSHQLLSEGETVKLLTGGAGGFGNEHFKSSTNTTPKQTTPGKPGEAADFLIELRLVVDAGFIGLPNAGKSTLLNELTNARAKVGHYAFTTLDPNLGDLDGFVLADIPGLISGAASGRGLGHKFLKHVTRTRLLVHCISLENTDVVSAYTDVHRELESYDAELVAKPEIVVLTKSDVANTADAAAAQNAIREHTGAACHTLSVLDEASIAEFRVALLSLLSGQ